jgi:hypothetical protein
MHTQTEDPRWSIETAPASDNVYYVNLTGNNILAIPEAMEDHVNVPLEVADG